MPRGAWEAGEYRLTIGHPEARVSLPIRLH
jgi:hypothetical protein